jgi:tripartite-type tricarboxylate transporter receptor subunit TctC
MMTSTPRRPWLAAASLVSVLALLPGWACAQAAWPTKPIRIVVPYPAGGTSDNVARLLAPMLQDKLGQTVVVDNRGGGGTVTGTVQVAKSEADGHTLLLTSTPLAINETLIKDLPYKTFTDLVPVAVVAQVPLVMIVNPSSKAKTVAEFVQLAKQNPGRLTYGSSGNGGSPHLSMEVFQSMTQTKLVHVPYKGSAPAVLDLGGGQTDVVVDTLFLTQQQVNAGKARALAQLGARRSALMPDVPTLQEAGLQGFDISSWFMLVAPAATPQPVVQKLNALVNEFIGQQKTKDVLAKQGLEPVGGSTGDALAFLKANVARFGDAVKRANVTTD